MLNELEQEGDSSGNLEWLGKCERDFFSQDKLLQRERTRDPL